MMTVLGVAAAIYGAAYFLPTIVAICRGAQKGWGLATFNPQLVFRAYRVRLLHGLGLGYGPDTLQNFGPPPNVSGCLRRLTGRS